MSLTVGLLCLDPDIPCDMYLNEEEWIALHAYVKRTPTPGAPPSLREAVRMIAKLGGFLGRKSDGAPGTMTMWRGLERLADITAGYWLGRSLPAPRADPEATVLCVVNCQLLRGRPRPSLRQDHRTGDR